MRTPIRTVAGLALLAGLGAMHAQTEPSQTAGAQRTHRWWTDRPAGARAYTTNAKTMPLISVKGNKFIDPQGRTILFRGLSISDPVGSDADRQLGIHAEPLGRVRQTGHARRGAVGGRPARPSCDAAAPGGAFPRK